MKNKVLFISLLFVLSALCGIFAGIIYIKNDSPDISYADEVENLDFPQKTPLPFITQQTPSPTPPEEAPVFDSEQYVVTLSDTKILIYKIAHDGSMQTIEEKHIDIGTIPHDDYAKLYSGIIVATLEDARQIVEDYIS